MPKKSYYVASDAMGNATAILDENGNVLERRRYEAFGEMTCMTPDGLPTATSPTGVDVGSQGQIREKITGLYQMGFRWHNPIIGRWTSRDKVGLYDGVNVSAFVRNSPMDRSDFIGLSSCKEGEVKNWQVLQVYDCYNEKSEDEFKTEIAIKVSAIVGVLLLKDITSTPHTPQDALAEKTGELTEEITQRLIEDKPMDNELPEIDETTSNLLRLIKHTYDIRKAAIFAYGTYICVKAQWEKCEENCFWQTKWTKKSKMISFPIGRQQAISSEADKIAASEKAKRDLFK